MDAIADDWPLAIDEPGNDVVVKAAMGSVISKDLPLAEDECGNVVVVPNTAMGSIIPKDLPLANDECGNVVAVAKATRESIPKDMPSASDELRNVVKAATGSIPNVRPSTIHEPGDDVVGAATDVIPNGLHLANDEIGKDVVSAITNSLPLANDELPKEAVPPATGPTSHSLPSANDELGKDVMPVATDSLPNGLSVANDDRRRDVVPAATDSISNGMLFTDDEPTKDIVSAATGAIPRDLPLVNDELGNVVVVQAAMDVIPKDQPSANGESGYADVVQGVIDSIPDALPSTSEEPENVVMSSENDSIGTALPSTDDKPGNVVVPAANDSISNDLPPANGESRSAVVHGANNSIANDLPSTNDEPESAVVPKVLDENDLPSANNRQGNAVVVHVAADSVLNDLPSASEELTPKMLLRVPKDAESHESEGELEDDELDSDADDVSEPDEHGLYDEGSADEDTEHSSSSLAEVPLSDEAVQDLVDELFKVESEAAEAQEMLEEESLLRVKESVREELAGQLSGSELDSAVEEEMNELVDQWEEQYEELQEQSSLLQEKLEDAGVSLPDLFKSIEKQAPEGCLTDAWKERTHWAGHQPSLEIEHVVKSADEELKVQHPTRSLHGKLLDEGASGFLKKKLAVEAGDDAAAGTTNCESPPNDGGWSKVDDLLDNEDTPNPGMLMGTKRWAAVYLASTPEQAAQLGLSLPGVDTVEEIGDIESERRSYFKAAVANEKERGLTERQKNSIKKVREEDDVRRSRWMPRRPKKRTSQLSRVKSSTRDSQSHLGKEKQPEKAIQQGPMVRGYGESRKVLNEDAQVIDLISDDEKTNDFEPGYHVHKAQTTVQVVSNGSDLHDDSLRHDDSILGKPETNTVDVGSQDANHREASQFALAIKAEQHHGTSDGNLCISVSRPDPPDAVGGSPSVELSPLGLEILKRKSPHKVSGINDEDPESSSKKAKYLVFKDEGGLLDRDEAEENVSTLKQNEGLPSASRDLVTVYRTTVIIDSDGEREVEEAVMPNAIPTENLQLSIEGTEIPFSTAVSKELNVDRPVSTSESPALIPKVEAKSETKKRKWKPQENERRCFPCTACGVVLRTKDVLRHPRLPVGICWKCTKHYLSGPFRKDEDGSDSECSWCGEGGEVVCCDQCDKVFCQACITRNFGVAENMRIVVSDDWLCYFCNPVPLSFLTAQLRMVELDVKSGYSNEDGACVNNTVPTTDRDSFVKQSKYGKHRKNIRKVLDDDELEEKQKDLLAREKERRERLEQWRRSAGDKRPSNHVPSKKISTNLSGTIVEDSVNKDLINVARAEGEAEVRIAPSLARVLKPHQVQGVRFMWENCIESEKKVREGSESNGCILAHSMGLGKTLQVITFIHTVLNRDLRLRTALVVVPVNVLHNWKKEFDTWQAGVTNPVSVHLIEDTVRDNTHRAAILHQWKDEGGVMLIGYAAFRNLSLGRHVKEKETRDKLCYALQNPGPDLLVCDEAHTIKNGKADITQVLKQVKTRRRIALTGTPLQNNLMEYYCMVDFVREGFLGTPHVFKNRFQNPIENGQHADSTKQDVKFMKQRAHVLNKQLMGFVQRINTSVLKDELPPKCVYVISVRLSPLQRQLYTHYLQVHGLLQTDNEVMENKSQRRLLFQAYHALAKVWNHPDLLLLAEEERTRKQDESMENFPNDSEEEKLSDGELEGKTKISAGQRPLKKKGLTDLEELEKPLWWKDIIPEDFPRGELEMSGKMVLLLRILTMSSRKGDKVLVFSQSLGTLSLIEKFLHRVPEANGYYWQKDKQWYRLDGSTPAGVRMQMCERFNDPSNTAVKCVLISTRAGSLGINLPAANRVIIADGSWNPTHDLQALFRAWRLGQRKPVYAYRLLAHGTMEEKIYSRQVAKEGVAARVLDEQQVGRHFDGNDLEFLFRLEDDGDDFVFERKNSRAVPDATRSDPNVLSSPTVEPSLLPSSGSLGSTSRSKLLAFTVPRDAPPRDDLMGNLLIDFRPRWVVSYHEHEPLLEHREDENLTSEERAAAWESYKNVDRFPTPVQTATLQTNTQLITHNSLAQVPAGGMKRCHTKEHAKLLSENSIPVGKHFRCPTCLLLISWENLLGARAVLSQ